MNTEIQSTDELHSFTLCHSDWQIILNSLYEAAGERLSRADSVGLDSVYGSTLYADGQMIRAVADYIEFHLPGGGD